MKQTVKNRLIILAATAIVLCSILLIAVFAIDSGTTPLPVLSIKATNLSFSESTYIKYAVSYENVAQVDKVKLLVWTSADNEYVLGTQDVTLSSVDTTSINGIDCLVFDFKDLSAKQMTDYVYARAYIEIEGKIYYSDVKKYSVLTYVYNKLGYTGTATQNEKLADLLQGLIEYGASAQMFFDYKTDTLATDRHVKVTLENGLFEDGSSFTLATPGTKLTITAHETVDNGGFAYWADQAGNLISKSPSYTMTVGDNNAQLNAVYIPYLGGYVDGSGSSLSDDSFAMTEHAVNTDSAIDVTASVLEELLVSGLENGKTYRVTDGNEVNISTNVNGNSATVIVPGGLVIKSANNISVNDLVVVAPVSVLDSTGVSFCRVDVQGGDSTALNLNSASSSVRIDDCRLISGASAMIIYADNVTVTDTYASGARGIETFANETTVQNCFVTAGELGIVIWSGEDAAFNYNSVTVTDDPVAAIAIGDALNTLVTFNSMSGAEHSVFVDQAVNTSVLFNSAYSIKVENAESTYVVKNGLNGKLSLTDNNYLLCDNNTFANDGNDHSPSMSGNQNVNGNDITDVNARPEVGANEDILPHTNKDLFLDMTPKTTVKDAVGGTSLNLGEYILTNASGKSIVIVPPGYYQMPTHYTFEAPHSNTEIYAYGVYNERDFAGANKQNLAFQFGNVQNLEFHGITVGYNHQSAGQVHVLKKASSGYLSKTYTLTLASAAGYLNSFGSLDTSKFSSGNFDLVKQGEIHWSNYSYSDLTQNSDGTMTMTVPEAAYNNIVAGDVLYCRLAGDNQSTVYFGNNADNITLKDFTLYGYAAALAIVPAHGSGNITLERVHNTVHSPYVIDKATYDKYAAWETDYNVELVSIDEEGRYRGTAPVVGSVDATHVNGANTGLKAVSCLFENMCDDGSNHRGSSSRLHDYRINNDGTVTLYIKANVAEYYRNDNINKGKEAVTANPQSIEKGDQIYIYTSKGELFCDTPALSTYKNTNTYTSISYNYNYGSESRTLTYTLNIFEVNVDADACNFDVLEGYDLSDNNYQMTQKVLVDNINRNGAGGHFDNVVVQNIRSRGFLVKSNDITIEHCTFRNLAMTSVLMCVEPIWGESTVARNVIVRNTLFDTTSFRSDSFDKEPLLAPIAIQTLTTYGNHATDSLRAENIVIEGNEFRNYGHSYGIYVNGAKDVHILNNVFDPRDSADANQKFVYAVTAADIEISGNKYKNSSGSLSSLTVSGMDDVAYIHGDNVSGSTTSDTDIFINGKHIMYYHVVAQNTLNQDIADSLASTLSSIDDYTVRSAKKLGEYNIILVARDNSSESIANKNYTVTCEGNNLTITAETRGALAYAASDFANSLNSITDKTYSISSGYTESFTFTASSIPATDLTKFKYVGTWQATDENNPTTMVSYWDSAYVEFDFTGTSATLLFSSPSKCNISIDGEKAQSYTVQDEITISATTAGKHTVRVHYGDKSAHMYFAGVRVPEGETVSRTADRPVYIQFVGDSISDAPSSFTHRVGDILGWDYSVIACEALSLQADKGYWRYNNGFTNDGGYAAGSMAQLLNQNFGTVSIGMEDAFFKLGIPNKSFPAAGSAEFNDIAANYFTDKYDYNFGTGYTPDIVFIFLGTNDLAGSSTETDINNFVAKYKEFVANILAVYGSDTKISAMQAISTSDASNMYDTNHPRYKAIAQAASELESLYGDNFNFIDAATVQSWGVQISSDATHPTESGYDTLTTQISKYLFTNYVDQNYVNHSFDISAIRKYEGGWKGVDSTGTDNGISYSHFSFSSNGHINISGKNDNYNIGNYAENRAITINGSTGQYLVLMYRASASHPFTLELRTTSSSDKSSDGNDGRLSAVVKPQALVSTDWEIAVVDLSQFENYQCNTSNLRVQVRITTTMSSFDIAYAGLVDNLEEASWIAQFKLNSGKMVVYNDFSAKGKNVYFSEDAEQKDILAKLTYVNHLYDMTKAIKYLSVGNATSGPDLVNEKDSNGTKFCRFNFTSDGHVFFDGVNGAISTKGDSGRYFVMKYRNTGTANRISINAMTSNFSAHSTVTKPAELVPTEWEIAVVDLSQFANYSIDSNNGVMIRFTTMCGALDIAFAGIVDDIDEAESFISVVSSNTSYVLYENWSTTGVAKSID